MKKIELLSIKMNKLGLPKKIERYFFNPKHDTEEDVITLREFFSINHELKTVNDFIYTSRSTKGGFTKKSPIWKSLKELLLKLRFNYRDTVLLLPETITNDNKIVPNLFYLSKEQLLTLPIKDFVRIRSRVLIWLTEYIHKTVELDEADHKRFYALLFSTPIKKLVALNGLDIQTIMKRQGIFHDIENRRSFRITLDIVQKKLKDLGLGRKMVLLWVYTYILPVIINSSLLHIWLRKNFSQKKMPILPIH